MDHAELVRRLEERVRLGLTFEASAEQGETGGAAFVRDRGGGRLVVTSATIDADAMRRTARILERVRASGLPVPRIHAVEELDDGTVAVLGERLPGAPAARVDSEVIDRIVEVNERFAGLLSDVDAPPRPLHLVASGTPVPDHEAIAAQGPRARYLVERIEELGRRVPEVLPGVDLVHPDLTAPNVLLDRAGRVSGVVDWNNGLFRGDRRFALIKLYFDLAWATLDEDGGIAPDALPHLEEHLRAALEPDLLEASWAHWTLVMLHWTIRDGNERVVDLHLTLGENPPTR